MSVHGLGRPGVRTDRFEETVSLSGDVLGGLAGEDAAAFRERPQADGVELLAERRR